MPHNRQEFYSFFLRSFGWEIQGIAENVDKVQTQSFGTTLSSGTGHQNATFWHHPYTNNTTMNGSSFNTGWASQMGNQVTNVRTSLSVTYRRGLSMPHRDRLAQLESQCWPFIEAYLKRLDSCATGNTNWREWQNYAYLIYKGQNLQQAGTENPPKATAKFLSLDAEHSPDVITLRVSFTIQNRRSMNCLLTVYFETDEGLHLRDEDAYCDDRRGNVAVVSFAKPRHDDSRWDDFHLTLPINQLHIGKKNATIRYYATLTDVSTDSEIARTTPRRFAYSRSLFGKVETLELPSGAIETIGNVPAPPPAQKAVAPNVPAVQPVSPAAVSTVAPTVVPTVAPTAVPVTAPVAAPKVAASSTRRHSSSSSARVASAPKQTSIHRPSTTSLDTANPPPAIVTSKKANASQDTVTDGRLGIQIRMSFRVKQRAGRELELTVYLQSQWGKPLKDVNRQYNTASGDVCVSARFIPESNNAVITDLALFIPYEELDLPDGEYGLMLKPVLLDEDGKSVIANFDSLPFHYSQDGDHLHGVNGWNAR